MDFDPFLLSSSGMLQSCSWLSAQNGADFTFVMLINLPLWLNLTIGNRGLVIGKQEIT